MIHVAIEGGKQIEANLAKLERKVAQKIVKKAARTAFKPTLAAARANAIGAVGGRMGARIAKALKIYTRKRSTLRRGEFGLEIREKSTDGLIHYTKGSMSSLVTKKTTGRRYHIPTAIEYGHAFPGRGGKRGAPKDVKPRPFMKPAFETTKDRASRVAADKIKRGIEAAL